MDLNLGNTFIRHYSGQNWTFFEIGVATRPRGGLARRESALQVGYKSEHLLEQLAVDNPADRYVAPDGTITYGKICVQGSRSYALSAEQVFSAQLLDRTLRDARAAAEKQAAEEMAQHEPPIDVTFTASAAAAA